jgi:aerobic-type carbon monoxide dehydrogenase small subunit (CoxS/CutS family)
MAQTAAPETITLEVNGRSHHVEASRNAILLDVLRQNLKLTGSKEACGRGECGACTVLLGETMIVRLA